MCRQGTSFIQLGFFQNFDFNCSNNYMFYIILFYSTLIEVTFILLGQDLLVTSRNVV